MNTKPLFLVRSDLVRPNLWLAATVLGWVWTTDRAIATPLTSRSAVKIVAKMGVNPLSYTLEKFNNAA